MSRWWRLRCWRDLLYRYDFDACIIFNFELVSSLPPLLCKWQTSITSLLPLREWSLRLNLWEWSLCWRAYPSLAVIRILQRYTISLPLGVHHVTVIPATNFQLTDIPWYALSESLNVTLMLPLDIYPFLSTLSRYLRTSAIPFYWTQPADHKLLVSCWLILMSVLTPASIPLSLVILVAPIIGRW